VKKQTEVEGALEVMEDVLRCRKMGLTRIEHVEVHLLDHIGDVRPGEGEVLESPSQATVGSRVADGGARTGDLSLSVDWHGAGLVVTHVSTLKDVPSVLALVKEEVVMSLLHWDVEEVVEKAEVLHCELLLESCSGMPEKLQT
jgi:hypothetical protein